MSLLLRTAAHNEWVSGGHNNLYMGAIGNVGIGDEEALVCKNSFEFLWIHDFAITCQVIMTFSVLIYFYCSHCTSPHGIDIVWG